ncbi:MAG: transketolase [Selenomonadaceae bacterium]|nr:transketolase [Selenomonadaceae bacterium]
MSNIETMCVNAIRVLSADAIQKAKSGHPGMPLGAAPLAYELWAHHMNHNPKNPNWINRDRFILSSGHASAMLYSLLHLFGYGLTIDDMKDFRQDGSLTPGHPEYGRTIGVEGTTGPLGSGIGLGVGMAMAEAHLATKFNKPDYPIVNHYTFVVCGDGCLMEGISSEALSLAGNLGLGKLIVIYDSNRISIEGSTDITFTENVQQRVAAFGFQTITVEDGNNLEEIDAAIAEAKLDTTRPSFITVKTEIGYGSPKQGLASSHGEPLGEENVIALKKKLNWNPDTTFDIPDKVYEHYNNLAKQGAAAEEKWNSLFAEYAAKFPEDKKLWDKYNSDIDAEKLFNDEKFWSTSDKVEATRSTSGNILNYLKDIVPNLIGGSADLGPSNKTIMKGEGDFSKDNYCGRNVHFGIREMAMAAVCNGLILHGGIRPYCATFFVFSDYLKPIIRLSSLMKVPVIYVFTHDSIGVGEDGPTHQPIEQLAMLRSQPNLNVFRPADAKETAVGWYLAITSKETPTALILTRQNIPQLANSSREALKGGYIISEAAGDLQGILIATGSEVSIAVDAQAELAKENIFVRVVSMPCMEIFDKQSDEYKESVLPKKIRARVAIEAASDFGWQKYIGLDGAAVTMKGFGASAPGSVLFKKFGFTKENVVSAFKNLAR